MEKWQGKLAVVTGASAGIGKAIMEALAKNGINVIGLARRVEKIEEIVQELKNYPGKAYAYKCDVSDPASVTDCFKWIEEKFGTMHILVNNAGVGRNVMVLDTTKEAETQLHEVLSTNFTGLLQCTREAFRLMKKHNDYGYIININSILGKSTPFLDLDEYSHNLYSPSKFALTSLTEVIRQELIKIKCPRIRVSGIHPGYVTTEIFEAANWSDIIKNFNQLTPENVADSLLYMLSTPCNVNVTELVIKPVGERC